MVASISITNPAEAKAVPHEGALALVISEGCVLAQQCQLQQVKSELMTHLRR